jgi:hypothetical protein
MADLKKDSPAQPATPGKTAPQESESMRQLERDADEMAEKAGNVEDRYDDDHGIFTK